MNIEGIFLGTRDERNKRGRETIEYYVIRDVYSYEFEDVVQIKYTMKRQEKDVLTRRINEYFVSRGYKLDWYMEKGYTPFTVMLKIAYGIAAERAALL